MDVVKSDISHGYKREVVANAYGALADIMEAQLASDTDTVLSKPGERGLDFCIEMKPIIDCRKEEEQEPRPA
eukprot:11197357-Alexandrium_andersonii.AAC.1